MSDATPESAAGQPAPQPARKRRRVWPWMVGGFGVVVVGVGALFTWDAKTMLDSSDALTAHATAAKEAVSNRDASALAAEVDGLEESARAFADATSGFHWSLAARMPWVSDQVRPLMAAGDAVDAMATEALAPLAQMDSLDALAVPGFENGRIDPYVLEPYREPLAAAVGALDAQSAALGDVSLAHTVDQVATPFLDLREQVDELSGLVGSAHAAAELLPSMLGGEGERTYLVMVQNNAEPRASGGIPGAIIEIAVQDGRIELGDFRPASSLVKYDGVGGLSTDEARIFGDQMQMFPQDVNFTPEFPRAAELMTRFWTAGGGDEVDGVVSIDPIALGWMLEGAAPVAVGPFEITSDNLADVMLSDAYFEYANPADQDDFFARASAALFGEITSGRGSAVQGVERAIDAGRLMVWSSAAHEQDLLQPTRIAGAFLEREGTVGVFVNDGSGSKIGYYIDAEATVTDRMCADGSIAGQTISITYTHTFDGDAESLPEYVAGEGIFVPLAEFHANVLVYPAVGTGITRATLDGDKIKVRPEHQAGRTLATARIELAPGASTTLQFEVDAHVDGVLPPEYVQTPGPREVAIERLAEGATGC
ncbi:DUF4012 domain-containing protein [Demequina phytophila]|uniref:DUF4012 domain-containing protein n=1 Tax=Demequina phytophila TaxID=1638981 RepID=UPI0007848EB5|nr:DUF4012 domain-containing protein [Demequina phytophila]